MPSQSWLLNMLLVWKETMIDRGDPGMPNMKNMESTSPTEFNKLWRGSIVTSLKFAVGCEIKSAPFEEKASCRWHASSERKTFRSVF